MIPLLESLSEVDDVRKYIPQFITHDHRVDFQRASHVLAEAAGGREGGREQKKVRAAAMQMHRVSEHLEEDEEDDDDGGTLEQRNLRKHQQILKPRPPPSQQTPSKLVPTKLPTSNDIEVVDATTTAPGQDENRRSVHLNPNSSSNGGNNGG